MPTDVNKPPGGSVFARFGIATLCLAIAWLACVSRTPVSGQTANPFLLAVIVATWYGGLAPGIFSVVVSSALGGTIERAGFAASLIQQSTFILIAGIIVAAIVRMHRAQAEANQAIQERDLAELRQNTTLGGIGDAVLVTDESGFVTYLNSEAERLTGWKNDDARGRPLPSVFHIFNEKTRQPAENPVDTVLKLGTVVGLASHTVLLSKDGRETPIDDSAAPVRANGGPVLGVVLVFRDAALQRNARVSSERLAAIVEHSGDAIATKNLDSVIQTWNAAAEKLFGYPAEEIVGKPVTILFPPDRLSEEDEIIARLKAGQPVERFETVRIAKDGRHIPVAVSISPLRNEEGEVIGASKVLHDISEVVAAREAVIREKELLSTSLSSIGDAVVMTDEQGMLTFMNGEAERLTGWIQAEAAGHPLPDVFRIINEQTRLPVENPVDKVLRLGSVVGLANHTILISKDGRETPIDDSAAPIKTPDGPMFGVVLVFRDFTERRQMEETLRLSQERLAAHATELERTVTERTAKLQEMVDELQHVSYAISHDMRAPLRAMNTFANLLLQDLEEGVDVTVATDYCQRIITASERLDKLIQDALQYTRVVQQGLLLVPVSLFQLITDLIRTYPNLHSDKADITIAGELPTVLGSDALLSQCFSNLLGNAVKFVPTGVRPRVTVSAENRGSTARIWVEDNGIGIPNSSQGRLFKMFQKLDTEYEGTGIGLAIVHKVVERMGGSVGVESEPGEGSRFWVELQIPGVGNEDHAVQS